MASQLDLFDAPVAQKSGRERRIDFRYEANWPVQLTFGERSWDATVVDASVGGIGIDRDLPVEKGALLTAVLPGIGSYPCRMAWKYDGRCGFQFVKAKDDLPDEAITSLADSILLIDQS